MTKRNLVYTLLDEKTHNLTGGIYHKIQVDFAYNSNHIEGSQLSHEQTRYIFETKTVGIEPAKIDEDNHAKTSCNPQPHMISCTR